VQDVESNFRDDIVEAFRESRSAIYGIARRYCGDDAAADVTQDVFLRVWNNPTAFDAARGNLGQYMCTLARGIAIDHLRRRTSRQNRDVRHASSAPAADSDLAHRLIDSEAADRVRQALGHLQSGERHAIMMAFFGEMTYREVAIRLGVAEGTAKSRIRAGLAKLREELGADFTVMAEAG